MELQKCCNLNTNTRTQAIAESILNKASSFIVCNPHSRTILLLCLVRMTVSPSVRLLMTTHFRIFLFQEHGARKRLRTKIGNCSWRGLSKLIRAGNNPNGVRECSILYSGGFLHRALLSGCVDLPSGWVASYYLAHTRS